ncbi:MULTISPECIES: YciI family protein [Microbacterium]|uniref:YciI family protein n=1 Tax=Microbacterium TaxID=33882 RepID=UPI00146C0058|nr:MULTISPECIES: YciI family protein [Microbacterium]
MRFLMLVLADAGVDGTEEPVLTIEEWATETSESGVHLDGDRLQPPERAKTVRRRGGKVFVTDGPFAETREVIAGFDILECRDMDHAVEVATRHPMATHGTIEVRELWPLDL